MQDHTKEGELRAEDQRNPKYLSGAEARVRVYVLDKHDK